VPHVSPHGWHKSHRGASIWDTRGPGGPAVLWLLTTALLGRWPTSMHWRQNKGTKN